MSLLSSPYPLGNYLNLFYLKSKYSKFVKCFILTGNTFNLLLDIYKILNDFILDISLGNISI